MKNTAKTILVFSGLVFALMLFSGCVGILNRQVSPEPRTIPPATVPDSQSDEDFDEPADMEEEIVTSTDATTSSAPDASTTSPKIDLPKVIKPGLKIPVCKIDSDCVPKPECHPHECIPKITESQYQKPEMCTMMFDVQAAYSASDCACEGGACVNKNLGKTFSE